MNEKLQCTVDEVGGQAALARLLNEVTKGQRKQGKIYKQQNVWMWLNISHMVPAEIAIPLEIISKGRFPRHVWRPDVYPPPDHEEEIAKRLEESNQLRFKKIKPTKPNQPRAQSPKTMKEA